MKPRLPEVISINSLEEHDKGKRNNEAHTHKKVTGGKMVVVKDFYQRKNIVLSEVGLEVCLWQVSVTKCFSSENK